MSKPCCVKGIKEAVLCSRSYCFEFLSFIVVVNVQTLFLIAKILFLHFIGNNQFFILDIKLSNLDCCEFVFSIIKQIIIWVVKGILEPWWRNDALLELFSLFELFFLIEFFVNLFLFMMIHFFFSQFLYWFLHFYNIF